MKGAQDGTQFGPGQDFALQNPVHALGKRGSGILRHPQAARRTYPRIFREALYRGIDPVPNVSGQSRALCREAL